MTRLAWRIAGKELSNPIMWKITWKKLSKEDFNLATSVLHGVITRAVRGCDENKVRTIIKDGYLDM